MNTKNIVIGVLVVTTLLFGGLYLNARSVSNAVGKNSGLSHFQTESFLQGLAGGLRDQFQVSKSGVVTQGGTVLSTSTQGTVTLSASEFLNYGNIVNTPVAMAGTIKMPSKATLLAADPTFLLNAGDRTTRYFFNATGTATSLTTFAGNTGMIMQVASSTNGTANGVTTISGYGSAMMTFWRSSTSTDIYFQLQTFK